MSTEEEATATREALHGLKWPSGNPKMLQVDFAVMDKVSGLVSCVLHDLLGPSANVRIFCSN